MTNITTSNNPSETTSNNPSFIAAISPDFIRAFTPIILAVIGGGTAILVLFSPAKANVSAGMTFAGTAITAAAALAQTGKDPNPDQTGKNPESGKQ